MNNFSSQLALSFFATISFSTALLASPAAAHAEEVVAPATEQAAPVTKESTPDDKPVLGVGLRGGLLPPLGVVLDVRLHPFDHFTVGGFGMATGKQWVVGGDLSYELFGGGVSTPFLDASLMHYESTGDHWSKENLTSVTVGYVWKWRLLELQAGVGVLAKLSSDRAPCSGWFCDGSFVPDVLPTAEVAIRFNAL